MVTYNYLKHFKNNLEMKAENEEDYNLDKENNYFNEYEDESFMFTYISSKFSHVCVSSL